MSDLKTFAEVFDYFRKFKGEFVKDFMKIPWKGKDKQETALRLFAHLGLMKEFDGYQVCDGNFNVGTVKPIKDLTSFWNASVKDSGDKSDLTLMKKDLSGGKPTLVATTSKNLTKCQIGKLDVRDILKLFDIYKQNFALILCVVVRCKIEFKNMVSNAQK